MSAYEIPLNAPVWPFRANWRETVTLSYEFLTTVFSSENGTEQRRSMRQEPRVNQQATISALEENERQRLMTFVFENQAERIIFPDYGRETAGTVGGAGLSLALDADVPWITVGSVVMIRQGEAVQARYVSGVAGRAVGLAEATSYAGPVRVYPAFYAYMTDEIAADVLSTTVSELELEIDALPGFASPTFRGAPVTQFDGREVLTTPMDWADRTARISRQFDEIDFGVGRVARFSPVRFGTRIYRGTYPRLSRSEIDTLAAFFLRHRGRLKEFFLQTGTADLTPVAVSGLTLTCALTGQAGLSKNTVDRAIAITRRDGSVSYHRITALAPVSGNLQLTLADTTGGLALGDILRVSWLPLCRFAVDRLTIPYLTTEGARIELSVQTLPYVAAENA